MDGLIYVPNRGASLYASTKMIGVTKSMTPRGQLLFGFSGALQGGAGLLVGLAAGNTAGLQRGARLRQLRGQLALRELRAVSALLQAPGDLGVEFVFAGPLTFLGQEGALCFSLQLGSLSGEGQRQLSIKLRLLSEKGLLDLGLQLASLKREALL